MDLDICGARAGALVAVGIRVPAPRTRTRAAFPEDTTCCCCSQKKKRNKNLARARNNWRSFSLLIHDFYLGRAEEP
jgi:hypothetical protein